MCAVVSMLQKKKIHKEKLFARCALFPHDLCPFLFFDLEMELRQVLQTTLFCGCPVLDVHSKDNFTPNKKIQSK